MRLWPVPSWGSLQRSPKPPSWFSEGRFVAGRGRKREEGERNEERGKEGKGEVRREEGKGRRGGNTGEEVEGRKVGRGPPIG